MNIIVKKRKLERTNNTNKLPYKLLIGVLVDGANIEQFFE
jgi:hypothetical protein